MHKPSQPTADLLAVAQLLAEEGLIVQIQETGLKEKNRPRFFIIARAPGKDTIFTNWVGLFYSEDTDRAPGFDLHRLIHRIYLTTEALSDPGVFKNLTTTIVEATKSIDDILSELKEMTKK